MNHFACLSYLAIDAPMLALHAVFPIYFLLKFSASFILFAVDFNSLGFFPCFFLIMCGSSFDIDKSLTPVFECPKSTPFGPL